MAMSKSVGENVENLEPLLLLVGMYSGEATVENVLVLQKIDHRITILIWTITCKILNLF